jgi:hypothetical protein
VERTATAKALQAYERIGTAILVTEKIAARLEGASLTYLSALNCMTAAERNAVRAGTLALVDYVSERWRRPDASKLIAVRATLDRLAAGNGGTS